MQRRDPARLCRSLLPVTSLHVTAGGDGRGQGAGRQNTEQPLLFGGSVGRHRFNSIVTACGVSFRMRRPASAIVITVARSFVAGGGLRLSVRSLAPDARPSDQRAGWTAIRRRFINYWSAPFLALHGRVNGIYDIHAFHAFEQSVADRRSRLSLQLSAGDVAALRAVRAHPLCAGALRVAVGERYAFYRVLKQEMGAAPCCSLGRRRY